MHAPETTNSETWEIPVSAHLLARKNRALLKAKFKAQIAYSRFRTANLGVVGAYNTSNIGDLAMGWTVERLARQSGARSELQSIGGLPAFPVRKRTVLGGGGLLNMHHSNSTLHRLLRYQPGSLAFVGVDGYIDEDECSDHVRSMLQNVAWIGVRNEYTRIAVESITGRSDVHVSPDIAFGLALAFDLPPRMRSVSKPNRVLGINLAPNLLSVRAHRIETLTQPSEWFCRHLPEEATIYSQIGQQYLNIVRSVVGIYRGRGWTIKHIPFAVEDDTLARTVLAKDGVEFMPYKSSPLKVLAEVSSCTRMLASRFHSHVFALLAETPVLSLAYAPKCAALWSELGLNSDSQVTNLQLVNDSDRAVDALANVEAAVLSEEQHEVIQRQARAAVCQSLTALGLT